jgi:hypothetical protein
MWLFSLFMIPVFQGAYRGAFAVATILWAAILAVYPINGGGIAETTDLIGFSTWIGLNIFIVAIVLRAARYIGSSTDSSNN